jgi:hypothetical protein
MGILMMGCRSLCDALLCFVPWDFFIFGCCSSFEERLHLCSGRRITEFVFVTNSPERYTGLCYGTKCGQVGLCRRHPLATALRTISPLLYRADRECCLEVYLPRIQVLTDSLSRTAKLDGVYTWFNTDSIMFTSQLAPPFLIFWTHNTAIETEHK